MRNPFSSPRRPARMGTRSATCRASGRTSVLIPEDLRLDLRRLPGQLLLQLRVAHHLGVVLQRLGDLLLLRGGQHLAVLRVLGELDRQRREHDRAGEREPERQAEGAGGRVDAGGLARVRRRSATTCSC
jgi:hypothetical protein